MGLVKGNSRRATSFQLDARADLHWSGKPTSRDTGGNQRYGNPFPRLHLKTIFCYMDMEVQKGNPYPQIGTRSLRIFTEVRSKDRSPSSALLPFFWGSKIDYRKERSPAFLSRGSLCCTRGSSFLQKLDQRPDPTAVTGGETWWRS